MTPSIGMFLFHLNKLNFTFETEKIADKIAD